VQEFIAAARKTHDLLAGSRLLQQVAGHTAAKLVELGAELIFPDSEAKYEGPNKLLASLPSNINPKDASDVAHRAAKEFLNKAWKQATQSLSAGQQKCLNMQLAEQQLGQFLEFYSAWVPWDGTDAGYVEARNQADRLLAGRKALRDFRQTQKHPGVLKSPLDPSRETIVTRLDTPRIAEDEDDEDGTVIRYETRMPQPMEEAPLVLKRAEWLDAVSLLKRIRGSKEGGAPSTRDFGTSSENPYIAVLAADGDAIGKHLKELQTVADHRSFSQNLSAFAKAASDRIGKDKKGYCIYAGGDDVLALLPVNRALQVACELAEDFCKKTKCTMSIGIALVHYLEPLQTAVQYARDAEREAKDNGRNRLRVSLHTRSGEVRSAEHSWKAGYQTTDWYAWVKDFAGNLPRGLPYELEGLAREMLGADLKTAHVENIVGAEAVRILHRKVSADGGRIEKGSRLEEMLRGISTPEELLKASHTLIVCRWLSKRETKGAGLHEE
jgi:CRISPR-associated protein Cmr2